MRSEPLTVLPRPELGRPPVGRVPVPTRTTLDNGLRLVLTPTVGVPQIAVRLILPAGSTRDPAGAPGTASLAATLLVEGTERRPVDALHEEIDGLGAELHAHCGHDFAEVELTLLDGTLAEGLALLADVVVRPAFPESETERVRAEALDAFEARDDEPANVADDRIAAEIFGAEHPYGLPSFGTAAGVAAASRRSLVDFHRTHYRPEGAILSVAGAFDVEEVRRRLEEAFSGWSGRAAGSGRRAAALSPREAGVVVPWEGSSQAELRVGSRGLARASRDWIAASVANYVLGGSTILGRLGANLREEKGWTYGARSAFSGALEPGGWIAEVAVDAEVAHEARAEILMEAARMAAEPVPESELRRAKDALILSLPRAFETPGRVASRFAAADAYELPADYWERLPERIEAVSAEEVLRISSEHFAPSRLVSVTVGGKE